MVMLFGVVRITTCSDPPPLCDRSKPPEGRSPEVPTLYPTPQSRRRYSRACLARLRFRVKLLGLSVREIESIVSTHARKLNPRPAPTVVSKRIALRRKA